MSQLLQTLHSTVHHYFFQTPDLHAYIQNRKRLAHYNRKGVTIKVADNEDFQQLVETVDKFRDGCRIAERIGRGDVCVVAYKHDALAHLRWATRTPIPLNELGGHIVHLAPDEAYTYDAYTVPAFRRQGIGSEGKVFLMTYLAEQSIRCTYGDTRADNLKTQQGWRKRVREGRSRLLGVITVTKRLGWTRCTFFAETADTHPLIARLFHVSPQQIRIRSIDQCLHEEKPAS